MKKTAFIFTILISCLLLPSWHLYAACNSDVFGTMMRIQIPESRIGSAPRLFLADRTETKERIIYGTDPEMERAMDEQAREEKEKEEKAWKMLQNMNLYRDNRKPTHPVPHSNTPQQ